MRKSILFPLLYLVLKCINVTACFLKADFTPPNDKEIRLSTLELITLDGYSSESHEVLTEDGYIINIYRTPGKPGAIPFLLGHGLLGNSHTWVLNGKNYSLAYLIANENYDVWLGNVRGTTNGMRHVMLSSNQSQFFHFSIDEIGVFDLPAVISYIYKLTHQQIVFIGYSMSSNAALIMATQRHDMDTRVRLIILLVPPIFMNTADVASIPLVHYLGIFKNILDFLRIYRLPIDFMRYMGKIGCKSNNVIMKICEELFLIQFARDRDHIGHMNVDLWLNLVTDTTSTIVINHFIQWLKSGRFQSYDYGIIKNIAIYKKIIPPEYNLSDVKIPTAIFYSESDLYCSSQAVNRLYDLLPIKAGLFLVKVAKFSHMHFAFATNARDIVYKEIINIVKIYS